MPISPRSPALWRHALGSGITRVLASSPCHPEYAAMRRHLIALGACLLLSSAAPAKEPIRLPNNPALSPDGKVLAFDHNGDIWSVPTTGGVARALTQNPARDRQPKFSPDGREIAFVSDREGSAQVHVMPAQGGAASQVTYHTGGYALQEWMPDGRGWLVSSPRDYYWNTRQADRFFQVRRATDPERRPAEELIFDDYGNYGTLSPDGKKVLLAARVLRGGAKATAARSRINCGFTIATRSASPASTRTTGARCGPCGSRTPRASTTSAARGALTTSGYTPSRTAALIGRSGSSQTTRWYSHASAATARRSSSATCSTCTAYTARAMSSRQRSNSGATTTGRTRRWSGAR